MNARLSKAAREEQALSLAHRARALFAYPPAESLQYVTPLPGLRVVQHAVRTQFDSTIYDPVICLILQGSKEVSFGGRTSRISAGRCMLVSHDLPVRSRVIDAPYVAVLLSVQLETLRSLYDELDRAPSDEGEPCALEVHDASPTVLDAVDRYMSLAESKTDAKVLGPMIAREIHYRLLMDPVGGMLRSLIRYDSHSALVSRAITAIRRDFRKPIVVAELAREVGMSVSSFHRHFKTVTSLSPLQYQKELRLIEAQRLLRAGSASVSATAFEVGYESLSQFSREYSRKFGRAPNGDRAKPERRAS